MNPNIKISYNNELTQAKGYLSVEDNKRDMKYIDNNNIIQSSDMNKNQQMDNISKESELNNDTTQNIEIRNYIIDKNGNVQKKNEIIILENQNNIKKRNKCCDDCCNDCGDDC